MRIRPDGVELLHAARVVINAAIGPYVAPDCREIVQAVEQAMALATDRLSRDAEASQADIAVLEEARAAMRGTVLQALPSQRRHDARLVSKAISLATLQLINAPFAERREFDHLGALLGTATEAEASVDTVRAALPALNAQLARRIRAGETDAGTISHAATFAYLKSITNAALSESNPTYRRRAMTSASAVSRATPLTAQPFASINAAFAAWSDVPKAFRSAVQPELPAAQIPQQIDAWISFQGALGEAVFASSNVALATQADVFGWFAQRLAANHRVPMIAVEGAHQAHDLTVAIADKSAALFKLMLAPFRRTQTPHAKVARLPR